MFCEFLTFDSEIPFILFNLVKKEILEKLLSISFSSKHSFELKENISDICGLR